MPKYIVKPEKQDSTAVPAEAPAERWPTVSIDVSPEIIAALELDQDVLVTLRGKVVGLSSNQGGYGGDRNDLRIELRSVEAEPGEAADAEDDPLEADSMAEAMRRELDDPQKKAARAARKD